MTRRTTTHGFRLVLLLALLLSTSCARRDLAYSAGSLTLYPTQQQAQKHCPKDIVVWLNLPSGICHFKDQRWYGNTNNGAFVCQQEAEKAGDRATRNGQ